MIVCGWCGKPTAPDRCTHCRHIDPARPWVQRGEDAPVVPDPEGGRPPLDRTDVARRLADARARLVAAGHAPTVEALAEELDVSPRTVRRWRDLTR